MAVFFKCNPGRGGAVMRGLVVLAVMVPGAAWADEPSSNAGTDSTTCLDDSDVVGYRHCPAYGDWGQNLLEPYVFVDYGMNRRHFVSKRSGVSYKTTSTTTPAEQDSGSDATTLDERIGFGLSEHTYLAFDIELGNFAATDSNPNSRDAILAGLIQVGARGSFGIGMASVEIGAGGMTY